MRWIHFRASQSERAESAIREWVYIKQPCDSKIDHYFSSKVFSERKLFDRNSDDIPFRKMDVTQCDKWLELLISLYDITPFVSMLFYRKRKQERHSNTAPYLHCGMVIFVVIMINTWGIYYSENSVNSKQCQRCLQQVKTGGCWSGLIIQTPTRP